MSDLQNFSRVRNLFKFNFIQRFYFLKDVDIFRMSHKLNFYILDDLDKEVAKND